MSLIENLTPAEKLRGLRKFVSTSVHGRPYGVTLELTRRCNAKCDYCDHWREPKVAELNADEFVEIARYFDPLAVTICGGEPLIRPDVLEITRRIKEIAGYRFVAIITNGWFLSESKAQALLDTGVDQINVSLNYPDKRQDDDRKLRGLFDKIAHIVPWMAQRGAHVQLNTILMKENIGDVLRIVELAETWGAQVLFTLYSELPGQNQGHLFPPEMWPQVRSLCETLRFLRRTRGVVANEDWYLQMVPRYVEGMQIGGCTAGKRMIHITPQGMVRPCAELPVIMHYKQYSVRQQPATTCTACFQACRGEAQAPITVRRIFEYLTA